jgi:hypothetical protein
MEQYLHIYRNVEQDNWVHLLPLAQYMHNSWTNASMGYTPFKLLIGHTPTITVTHETTNVPEIACRKEWLEHTQQCAQAAIKATQNVLVTQGQCKKGQCHYKGHSVSNCHESMGWVTMQMELRLFFPSSHPLLHLGLSTTVWTLLVCRHIPWPHVFLVLLWTATTYCYGLLLLTWYSSYDVAWDGPDLRMYLCFPLSHSCTSPYGPAPFGLKRLLLLPYYYMTLTPPSALTRCLQ